MIGGKIIEVRSDRKKFGYPGVECDCLRIWCIDSRTYEECIVYVAKVVLPIKPGDSIWWQGGYAYWTPEGGHTHTDVRIKKLGYSYDPSLDSVDFG